MASPEVPAHRACAGCRSQKVRCILDDSNSEMCQRCARAGRPCVFTPLQKRKQRKRTDTRVAELEREMRAMRAALQQKNEAAQSNSPIRQDTQQQPQQQQQQQEQEVQELPQARPRGLWYKDTLPDAPRLNQAGSYCEEQSSEHTSVHTLPRGGSALWPAKFATQPSNDGRDVVDSGLISVATARQLFETYRSSLFPHYPMVAIPASTSAEEMRATKPSLFLAVIAAASGVENPDLSAALDKEVLQAYATKSLIGSEKSLELVQALLISAVWYHPPTKFGQLKYYEYIHMAATMAMDIGIGSRPSTHRSRRLQKRDELHRRMVHPAEDVRNPDLSMTPRSRDSSPDTSSVESRRTFLACYIICAGVSLSLRRPDMLRANSYVRECVDYIEQSRDALSTDSMLVAWVRLIMIAEEISISFCYDDPGGIASLKELRTQLMLKDFEKRLTTWYTNVPEVDFGSGSLLIMYYTIRLYLFEVALHVEHSPEDFRAPYQMGAIQPLAPSSTKDIPTQVLAECIAECITSSHLLLNTFLAMDVEACRALPVFSYVRISFGGFVLAKLCLSAAHPRSRIGRVLDKSSLKVESYMDRAILHVRNVVGQKRSRVPSIFLALLFKLRQWCLNPEILEQTEFDGVQPMFDSGRGLGQKQIRNEGDNDDDAADKPPRDYAIQLDGPRVTEHFSSSENSPEETMLQAQVGATRGSVGEQTTLDQSTNAPQNSGHPLGYSFSDSAPSAISIVPSEYNDMTTGSAGNFMYTDGMRIDQELLQFISEMNTTSEGGLTGLDDWASMPFNMDFMNWQMPTNNGGPNPT